MLEVIESFGWFKTICSVGIVILFVLAFTHGGKNSGSGGGSSSGGGGSTPTPPPANPPSDAQS